ncbi:pilus assembly PilX family protein [Agaribacterium haliotis]|uniref:pilus assembly PilX family protein n=1 Tax=Agaribacterium haliotis TaxID=2013869 RepID=UPI000BB590EA|nr:PilX N-terminal domain-containing pilus assembly protein [Agaribacterium haliotis]
MKIALSHRGATLVITLIILLVMSMAALSAMQGLTLQQRMAANLRQHVLAQSAAEFVLKNAESYLLANLKQSSDVNSLFSGDSGLYAVVPRPSAPIAQKSKSFDVNIDSSWTANNSVAVPGLSKTALFEQAAVTAKDPRYIIEYIGRGSVRASATTAVSLNLGAQQLSVEPFFFRITAIGWARDERIYSVLESVFRTGYGDGSFEY